MNLVVDKSSGTPLYEQVRDQIEQLVRDGLLPVGTRLPSVRQLAEELGVSKNTINQAYDELVAHNVVESRRGSGTFVTARPQANNGLNLRTQNDTMPDLGDYPPMRWEPYDFRSDFFMLPVSRGSDRMIRFTQAYPDPELFPFDRIKQATTNMLWNPQQLFFDIGHPQGYQPLVEHVEKEMALAGVPMAEGQNDIILTGGFQRALALVLDFLLKPGQAVAIESPTYCGLLNLLISRNINYVPIPIDDYGMDTDYLAGVLKRDEVKAIVTVPTFHNPTGICMSTERREHLMRLAMSHRVPVVEDDWARLLRFDGAVDPPLKYLDQGGYVIHIGTFSKVFLPGLRVGWITCPAAISVPLLRAKSGSDQSDSFFLQMLLHDLIERGHFTRHLRHANKAYSKRRDAMCQALTRYLPAGCHFRVPRGGFSVWLELPKNIMSVPLLTLARRAGVDYVPAAFVMPDRRDAPALRLSFSRNTPERIEEGIKTLCHVISDCIDNPDLLNAGAKRFEELF